MTEKLAEPPRPPVASQEEQRREASRLSGVASRLRLEQRSLLRGLVILAILVLLGSLARAGFGRLFVPGWWRQW